MLQIETLAEAGDPLAVLQAMHDLPHTEPGGGGPHEQNGDAAADPLQRVESLAEASDAAPIQATHDLGHRICSAVPLKRLRRQ